MQTWTSLSPPSLISELLLRFLGSAIGDHGLPWHRSWPWLSQLEGSTFIIPVNLLVCITFLGYSSLRWVLQRNSRLQWRCEHCNINWLGLQVVCRDGGLRFLLNSFATVRKLWLKTFSLVKALKLVMSLVEKKTTVLQYWNYRGHSGHGLLLAGELQEVWA